MYKLIAAIFTVALLITACYKEDHYGPVRVFLPGEMEHGYGQAQKNGTDFLASAEAKENRDKPGFYGIAFLTETDKGFNREILGFGRMLPLEGLFPLTNRHDERNLQGDSIKCSYSLGTDDGHVFEDTYDLDEGKSNFFHILRFDTLAGEIEGRFKVHFKIATRGGKRNPANPDRVKFEDGYFEVDIVE